MNVPPVMMIFVGKEETPVVSPDRGPQPFCSSQVLLWLDSIEDDLDEESLRMWSWMSLYAKEEPSNSCILLV